MSTINVPTATQFTRGRYDDAVALFYTDKLSEEELDALDAALDGLILTRMLTNDICPDIKINMFFVFEDFFNIDFNFLYSRGVYTRFAFLPVHKWREDEYEKLQIAACILEEACHLLMNITDEDLVKTKVLEAMYRARPEDMKNGYNPYAEWPSVLPFYMQK